MELHPSLGSVKLQPRLLELGVKRKLALEATRAWGGKDEMSHELPHPFLFDISVEVSVAEGAT